MADDPKSVAERAVDAVAAYRSVKVRYEAVIKAYDDARGTPTTQPELWSQVMTLSSEMANAAVEVNAALEPSRVNTLAKAYLSLLASLTPIPRSPAEEAWSDETTG